MKLIRSIFILILILFKLSDVQAQVKFAPKGAVWNEAFVSLPAWGGIYNYMNERITYVSDSIVNGDSVKILTHRFYYWTCYNVSVSQLKRTLIKQKGDTVFFSNSKTLYNWQILYNYAAAQGDSWTTTVLKANGTPYTYTTTVDSVKYVTENGSTLKRLYLPNGNITERYGYSGFLFNFVANTPGCDGYNFAERLCYSDSVFGTLQFTTKSCEFAGPININGVGENTNDGTFNIFPNPANDQISIESDSEHTFSLKIRNTLGQTVVDIQNLTNNYQLSLTNFTPGLYYLEIQAGETKHLSKLVKE